MENVTALARRWTSWRLGGPLGPAEIETMNGAQSILHAVEVPYGLQRICRVWHCARSSVYERGGTPSTLTPTSRSPPRNRRSAAAPE